MKLYWIIAIFCIAIFCSCGNNDTPIATQEQDQKQLGSTTGIYLIWHDDNGWQNNTFNTNKVWYSGDTLFIKHDPENIKILNTGGDFYITYFEILY